MNQPSRQFRDLKALLLAVLLLVSSASAADQFFFKLPQGISPDLWSYFIPKDNPVTPLKVELGRQLFFEKRLSADGSISCSSCHDPKLAFTDGRKISEGIHGRRGTRNTPTLLNAMFNSTLFWDGRVESLEQQALHPLLDPDEMGNASHEDVVKRFHGISEYVDRFQQVFGGQITIDRIAKAIASYERTLVSADAPFDRFQRGDRNAMNEGAQRGFTLFRTKARCSVCHNVNQSFPFFTDGNYRNTGVAGNLEVVGETELGRFRVTRSSVDRGAFRTASLRNVELTGPYFHDGSATTLLDVIRYYVRGGNQNAMRDWELQAINLTQAEQDDLIEFLKALTSNAE